jgi:hypothetical protein
MSEIDVEPADDESRRLWSSVGDLVALLPEDWVLIGGLMVQLHAFERGVLDVRATKDVDVLGQARPQGALAAIDAALQREGFTDVPPDLDGYARRYERDGLIVDVLAPDGVKPAPALGRGRVAIGFPAARRRSLARRRSPSVGAAARSCCVVPPSLERS